MTTNCENFDDGLTQVAPKGEFKAITPYEQFLIDKAIQNFKQKLATEIMSSDTEPCCQGIEQVNVLKTIWEMK